MKWCAFLILCIAGMVDIHTAMAQKKDSTWIGRVNGIIRDSAHDYELPSATVAIYTDRDSGLINYQLSDNSGKFQFKQLPTGVQLRLHVTYVGYKGYRQTFTIPFRQPVIDLDSLNIEMKGRDLDEVTITVPPVQLNGDTLEFNAQAFKLDPNAQTEDLLKMLPGVTVWSDGSITVNGKQVSMVLVEGKPFFGGNAKVATQNIPKNAVDKIQVYQLPGNINNPLDSVTAINIKLMKNKKAGAFGRVAASAGTRERYEADLSLNIFSPRTQLSFAGTGNNTNKIANDVKTIRTNSTFKGVGASIEYQPELTMQGHNRANNGGFTLQQDFIPDPGYFKNNRLTIDYFIKDHTTALNEVSQTTTRLPGDNSLIQQSQRSSEAHTTGQTFNAGYNNKNRDLEYFASIRYNHNRSRNNDSSLSIASTENGQPESSNSAGNSYTNTQNRILIETGIKRTKPFSAVNLRPGDYEINYSLNIFDQENLQRRQSRFTSFNDTLQNRYFNRDYNNQYYSATHRLYAKAGNFIPWLFGVQNSISRLRLHLQNVLEVTTDHTNDLVSDRENGKNDYITNNALSNNAHNVIVNEMPALNLSRGFMQLFDNRFQKQLTLEASFQLQFWQQKNAADHSFQNISNSYRKFVPKATLSYLNDQFGAFRDYYQLEFAVSADYPTIQQLAPLIDSSDMYYIQTGNPLLKPAEKRELAFVMNHTKIRSDNPFNYNINLYAGTISNYFATASIIDELGRSIYYQVNTDMEKHFGGSLGINKAFRFGLHQLEGKLSSTARLSQSPNLVNNIWNQSNTFNNNNELKITYTQGNLLAASLSRGFSYYRSRQTTLNRQDIYNQLQSTVLSASINCTSRLTLSSNISWNTNNSTNTTSTSFAIWNANTTYRMGKMKTFEIKLAALDLLRQNKGIFYSGSNNILTYRTVNVLQQYFMLTAAWFPRKFGKDQKNNNP